MNNKLYPCIWCDNNALEIANFYISVFENTKIDSSNNMVVSINISDQKIMLLNGGAIFKPNPSISYYTICESEAEIDVIWNKMMPGGNIMMPLNKYPWCEKYGWIKDKYGISWQLSLGKVAEMGSKITPTLMFRGDNFGKGEEAINFYTSILPNSNIQFLSKYDENDKLQGGKINHGRFTLCGQSFIIMDSGLNHDFNFTEGQSFVINCESQKEIDQYWDSLCFEDQQCGWLKDKFGVSWQIIPSNIGELLSNNPNAMDSLMKMKKIDIESLKTK